MTITSGIPRALHLVTVGNPVDATIVSWEACTEHAREAFSMGGRWVNVRGLSPEDQLLPCKRCLENWLEL